MQEVPPAASSGKFILVQVVTLVRLPLGMLLAIILLTQERTPGVLWGCVGLLALCEITDVLDGLLARRLGVTSELGATLDPYSDSVTRLVVYWSLACVGLVWAVVPLVMALRDVTVAYCRMVWVARGSSVAAKWSGKLKAIVQGTGAFVLVLGPLFWPLSKRSIIVSVSVIVLVATLASGFDYVRHTIWPKSAGSHRPEDEIGRSSSRGP